MTAYSKPLTPAPKTMRDGLANALQMAINQIERGEQDEAVYTLVNLIDDVISKSNPYKIDGKNKPAKATEPPEAINALIEIMDVMPDDDGSRTIKPGFLDRARNIVSRHTRTILSRIK